MRRYWGYTKLQEFLGEVSVGRDNPFAHYTEILSASRRWRDLDTPPFDRLRINRSGGSQVGPVLGFPPWRDSNAQPRRPAFGGIRSRIISPQYADIVNRFREWVSDYQFKERVWCSSATQAQQEFLGSKFHGK